MSFYIFQLIEGAEEAQFHGSILFGVVQGAAMGLAPGRAGALGKKDAHSVGELAVGGNVEDEFRRGRLGIVRQRGTSAHEVVLVDVPLGTGVGFHPADGRIGHADIMERGAVACRGRCR